MKSKGFFGILKWTLRESLGMIIVSIFSSLAVSAFIINKAAKASDLIYTLPDIKKKPNKYVGGTSSDFNGCMHDIVLNTDAPQLLFPLQQKKN